MTNPPFAAFGRPRRASYEPDYDLIGQAKTLSTAVAVYEQVPHPESGLPTPSRPYLECVPHPESGVVCTPDLASSGSESAAHSHTGRRATVPWPLRSRAWRPGRPLRAVHVGPCFCRGGAEQHLVDLARHFDPQRVVLTEAIVTCETLLDERVTENVPFQVTLGGPAEVQRAAAEADLLLYWGVPLDDFLPQKSSAAAVYLAHGDSAWTRELLEHSHAAVDHAIAVSARVEQMTCVGSGIPTTRILNGIDTSRLTSSAPASEIRRALGFSPQDFVLGFVGRFAHEKRPRLLIDAAALLPPEFKVLLVGWGYLQPELLEQANALIPGRFACLRLDRYLGDAYSVMDGFCLLSDQEGFALVLLEAMYSAVPVIATPVGAVPEFITDRVNGQIVDGSPAEIAAAAQRLRDYPQWARGMGQQAQTLAHQNGHASRMAVEYEALFEKLWLSKRGLLPAEGLLA
jgi:glycosyltransferase involved in cell wall biosynthesis